MGGNWGYVVAAAIGAIVGGTEMIYRYRDDASWTLLQPGGAIYTVVNGLASALALTLIRTFGWTFGAHAGDARDLCRVLIAGFGALALFRTKLLAPTKKDGASLSWSPSRLLEQLLTISDALAPRGAARKRSRDAVAIMSNVSFDKAHGPLQKYVLALLGSTTREQRKRLADDIADISSDPAMSPAVQAQQLAVALLPLTGASLLRQAVAALGPSIALDASKPVGTPLHKRALQRVPLALGIQGARTSAQPQP
ncbi:MAG TPA: hypothetical protein VHE57_14480 [Mycobacteriales bacterium]|nr:hypothetical protein [Mycobacteriales bacterium]